MRNALLVIIAGLFFTACNQSATSTETGEDSTAAMDHSDSIVQYPYSIENPDTWQTGSKENTRVALNALKAYENGNIDEAMNYFGDSVRLRFDGLDETFSKDSVHAMFKDNRSKIKSMEVKMDDWESVISKDKEDEFVSLWYKECWEDAQGKKDSAYRMDDIRLRDGKIVGIDEKSRKFPAKKM